MHVIEEERIKDHMVLQTSLSWILRTRPPKNSGKLNWRSKSNKNKIYFVLETGCHWVAPAGLELTT